MDYSGYGFTPDGTIGRPFKTVGEALAFYNQNEYFDHGHWTGGRIKIHTGSYPEALTFSRRMQIVPWSGKAVGRFAGAFLVDSRGSDQHCRWRCFKALLMYQCVTLVDRVDQPKLRIRGSNLMKINNFLGMTLLLFLLLIPTRGVAQERLLIIAPDEFIDELEPLKRFKEASGRRPPC